jgi:hypothetical protein
MLRLACCLATERGITVCAPVHDALLIEASIDELDDAIATTRRAMGDASDVVLDGLRIDSDVHVVAYPDRYSDERGASMWGTVMDLLERGSIADKLGDPLSSIVHPLSSIASGNVGDRAPNVGDRSHPSLL